MNKKQLFCLWFGIVIFVFVGLATVASSYSFGWKDFAPLLIVFWPSIAIVTGGLIYTLRDKKRIEGSDIKPMNLRGGFKRVAILLGIVCGMVAIGISIYKRSSDLSNLEKCEWDFLGSIPVGDANERPLGWPKMPPFQGMDSKSYSDYYEKLSSWLIVKKVSLPVLIGEEDKKFRVEHNIPPDSPDRFYTAESLKFINTYGKCIEKAHLLLNARSFWATLSTREFILAIILIGLGSTILGFCFTWFVYGIIRWLVVGFQKGTG